MTAARGGQRPSQPGPIPWSCLIQRVGLMVPDQAGDPPAGPGGTVDRHSCTVKHPVDRHSCTVKHPELVKGRASSLGSEQQNRNRTPFGVRRRVGEPGRPVMPSCIHPNTYRLVPRLLAIDYGHVGHGSGHCSRTGSFRTAGACLGPVGGNCTWSDSNPSLSIWALVY